MSYISIEIQQIFTERLGYFAIGNPAMNKLCLPAFEEFTV